MARPEPPGSSASSCHCRRRRGPLRLTSMDASMRQGSGASPAAASCGLRPPPCTGGTHRAPRPRFPIPSSPEQTPRPRAGKFRGLVLFPGGRIRRSPFRSSAARGRGRSRDRRQPPRGPGHLVDCGSVSGQCSGGYGLLPDLDWTFLASDRVRTDDSADLPVVEVEVRWRLRAQKVRRVVGLDLLASAALLAGPTI